MFDNQFSAMDAILNGKESFASQVSFSLVVTTTHSLVSSLRWMKEFKDFVSHFTHSTNLPLSSHLLKSMFDFLSDSQSLQPREQLFLALKEAVLNSLWFYGSRQNILFNNLGYSHIQYRVTC